MGGLQRGAVADIDFYFDPVCPFAWMTSKWVRIVQAQRDYTVDWSFISLRQLNAHIDYDTQEARLAGMRSQQLRTLRQAQDDEEARAAHPPGPGAKG